MAKFTNLTAFFKMTILTVVLMAAPAIAVYSIDYLEFYLEPKSAPVVHGPGKAVSEPWDIYSCGIKMFLSNSAIKKNCRAKKKFIS